MNEFYLPFYLGRSWLPKPDGYDRHGGRYKKETIDKLIVNSINKGTYFTGKGKMTSSDIEQATALLDDANDRFARSLDRFVNVQRDIASASRKASQDIRKATDSLAQGLARLEKVSNFSQLEKNVELLERAAKAIDLLYALGQAGKLEKISELLH